MTFRVDQKVVCVNAGVVAIDASGYLRERGIYRINFMRIDSTGRLCVWLDGVTGGWEVCRFRPVVDRKSEISFTHGADPSSDQFDNRRTKVGAPA
jgi:hypothetical protein